MTEDFDYSKFLFVPHGTKITEDPKYPGIIRYTGELHPFAPPKTPWSVKFALLFSIFSLLFNTYVLWQRMCR